MSHFVEFILKDNGKKIAFDRQNVAVIEDLVQGTAIHTISGAIFCVTDDYETASSRLILSEDVKIYKSPSRGSTDLHANYLNRPKPG